MKAEPFTALPYRRRDCELLGNCQGFCAYCVDCPNKPRIRTVREEIAHWLRFAGICLAIALISGLGCAFVIARFSA